MIQTHKKSNNPTTHLIKTLLKKPEVNLKMGNVTILSHQILLNPKYFSLWFYYLIITILNCNKNTEQMKKKLLTNPKHPLNNYPFFHEHKLDRLSEVKTLKCLKPNSKMKIWC